MFNFDLFILFLNCLLMSVLVWALGVVDWKPIRTGFIGLIAEALWFILRNRIQRTVIPPRDKNWRVSFPLSSSPSCFSLHPAFPFLPGLFTLQLFIPSGFGLPCHLVQPYFKVTLQFRYPSSKCPGYLCPRFLGVSDWLAQFHSMSSQLRLGLGVEALGARSFGQLEAASLGETQQLACSLQCLLPISWFVVFIFLFWIHRNPLHMEASVVLWVFFCPFIIFLLLGVFAM